MPNPHQIYSDKLLKELAKTLPKAGIGLSGTSMRSDAAERFIREVLESRSRIYETTIENADFCSNFPYEKDQDDQLQYLNDKSIKYIDIRVSRSLLSYFVFSDLYYVNWRSLFYSKISKEGRAGEIDQQKVEDPFGRDQDGRVIAPYGFKGDGSVFTPFGVNVDGTFKAPSGIGNDGLPIIPDERGKPSPTVIRKTWRVNEGVTEGRSDPMSEESKLDKAKLAPIFEGELNREAMAAALNRVMTERGLSVRKAADAAGTSAGIISSIKDQRASLDKAVEVLDQLGFETGFFVRPKDHS